MQQHPTNFMEWCRKYSTERACVAELARHRWPNGFVCPRCGHRKAHVLSRHHLRQCASCRHQTSVTVGTVFENTRLSLTKWFAAIYLMSVDKGGISASRLSKMIGVNWRTARLMLRKLRRVMGDRDLGYSLSGLVEVDDALVGGKQPGKRGRGASGKSPLLLAVERRGKGAGFLAAQVVPRIDHGHVRKFSRRFSSEAVVRSDALPALNIISEHCEQKARATPAELADEWLPMVHIVIGNLKRFLLGTFHGVSGKYLQEYVDEFVYRFNRRKWENQLPRCLLNAAASHPPVLFRLK